MVKKKRPPIRSIQIIGWSMLLSHLLFIWISTRYSIFPGYDALMNIVGTMAQIIAGLYGVTMASYTFFLSRIDGLCAQDTTLDYIAAGLKRRFKLLIWFISGNVLAALLISLVLLYCPAPTEADHVFFYRLFCNEFLLALCYSIGLILYYAIEVINPNALEKEAGKRKRGLSPGNTGDPLEFLALYGKIVDACNSRIAEGVLAQIRENKGNRFGYTLALLPRSAPELKEQMPGLYRIHWYYECTINTSPLTVSREMCALARKMAEALEPLP